MQKPKRQYRSFREYAATLGGNGGYSPYNRSFFTQHPGDFPCIECHGYGIIYDPDDPPCPIEGNKLRNRIKCPRCKGSCKGTQAEHKAIYQKSVADYKAATEEFNRLMAAWKAVAAKLTQADVEALKTMGFEWDKKSDKLVIPVRRTNW